MDTKRGQERKDLKVFLRLFDEKTNQPIGYVVNITQEGIMVTHEQRIDVDSEYRLRLVLSAEIEGKKEIGFTAKSRWTEKDSESDFYNTGFQFIDLSPPDQKIIDKLIRDFCFDTE